MLSWLFGHVAKRLDKKDLANFKFHDVTAWLKTIVIHILLNNSRSKGSNEIWLINSNMWNNFLKISYTKCVGETGPTPFSEKLKLAYLWINSLKFYTVCFFFVCSSWELLTYIETKLQTTLSHVKLFKN